MKAKEAFEKTIKNVFGNEAWDEIQDMYQNVLDNSIKGEQYGKYGCDSSTIQLMLHLRKLMRDKNFVPNKSIDKENIDGFFGKKENWLTDEYHKRFPVSWESEPGVRLAYEYDVDGWNYEKVKTNELDWIGDYKIYSHTHFYYNQLDHYLSYLVGAIRRNPEACDGIKKGKNIKYDLFKE